MTNAGVGVSVALLEEWELGVVGGGIERQQQCCCSCNNGGQMMFEEWY